MEVIIRPTADDAAHLAARLMARCLRDKPQIVFGLATGRTMARVYAILAGMHKDDGLDFSLAATFNLDEYVGLPPDNEQSYRHYMNTHLFRQVNIDLRNTYLPDGMAPDLKAECERYERLMADRGGIDFQLLGIGRSGHIGFNEPLSAMFSRTRVKALTPETVQQNAAIFGSANHVPRHAITMGVGTILDARRCVLLATGLEKADIVAKAVEGPITSMVSASALQMHRRCTVIVDQEAASRLENQEYYRWIFQNEPEWESYR